MTPEGNAGSIQYFVFGMTGSFPFGPVCLSVCLSICLPYPCPQVALLSTSCR